MLNEGMTTTTVRKDRLNRLTTDKLIGQYELAISSYKGRNTNFSPRQKRIDFIVELLFNRAENGDAVADAFFNVLAKS